MERLSVFIKLLLIFISLQSLSGAKSDRVLLTDVSALTLHHGKMTNSRRTSPVPQLKCTGGSAAGMFKPQTVQCINRGSDGYDVQWECKTDMDNSYRFGKLQVTCEGYDYPEDPYILRGSCGLEYTIDLTEEGLERKKSGGQHQYYGGHHHSDDYHDRSNYQYSYSKKASSVMQDLFYLGVIAGIIYIIYKTCIATPNISSDAPPPYDAQDPHRQPSAPPPPYGFRNEYMPGTGGGSCSSGAGYTGGQTFTPPGTNTGGGFWSGAFTGGLMGYLLGNRNNGTYTGYQRPHTSWWGGRNWGTGWGSGWGSGVGSGWGSSWGSNTYTTGTSSRGSGFSSAPRSSGTRTASGFGGTSRR
ncbi:store-operated calcium entry-associated regulatory factor-like [Mercenaria mercenaria]|uniref:store-operated calcium entry-associated regulatory factor-like n=1 Tax=Mercenaria mercenaria TaxID=6596 RepID=UPI00234EA056|nr:store-operated calcium entry-associated regulatory factor-like [Mercenaria mercenaria]